MATIKDKYLKYLNYMTRILSPDLPLFGVLFVMQSIQFCITLYFVGHIGIGIVLGTISWAYVLALPQKLIRPGVWRTVYATVAISASSIFGLLELFCALKLEEFVSSTHILLIAYSNVNESAEFISTYVDWKFILTVLAITVSAVFVYILMRKVKSQIFRQLITILSLFALLVTTIFGTWLDCGIGRVLYAVTSMGKIKSYNLNETQPAYDVCEISAFHPNIILIIGESFDKNHSNMYGYEKKTNPLLQKRQIDSTMVVFSDVHAPGPNTHLAIRQMLSLAERHDDELWYEKPILLTALSKSGYGTCWLSNQTPTYNSENLLGSFARLADWYVNTSKVNFYDISYDEVLFAPFQRYTDRIKDSNRNFCVVHLTGSHFKYSSRYPETFSKFAERDYPDQKENRRETFAAYDNSILYNDYVVDSLMKISETLDAIVIYTSDHGEDFYYTRDIATHGSETDPVSFEAGCRIPFMIYYTRRFRDKHPEIVERTKSCANVRFNTKYLMNTIMDMAGYDFCDSTIFDRSLFRGRFGEISNDGLTTE